MADKAVVTQTTLDAIGQAIIAKGGATAPMTPAQMPAAIAEIPSGGDENAVAMTERTITSYSSDDVTFIGRGAFYMCASLVSVSLPNATNADTNGAQFQGCTKLVNINLPKLTKLAGSMFAGIAAEEIDLPSAVRGTNALNQCFLNSYNLKIVRTPKLLLTTETTFFNGNTKLTDWYCDEIPCASIMAASAFPHMANMTAGFANMTIHGSDGVIKYIDGAWTKVEE